MVHNVHMSCWIKFSMENSRISPLGFNKWTTRICPLGFNGITNSQVSIGFHEQYGSHIFTGFHETMVHIILLDLTHNIHRVSYINWFTEWITQSSFGCINSTVDKHIISLGLIKNMVRIICFDFKRHYICNFSLVSYTARFTFLYWDSKFIWFALYLWITF